MYKMHVTDILAAFYIPETIILKNIGEIKCLRIKDSLQYFPDIYSLFFDALSL